jgi:hypothetical protein
MTHETEPNPVVFWCGVVVGGAICIYGLHGLIGALHGYRSRQFLQWFVGADLAHDLIVAPIACVVGTVVARTVPASARTQVGAGLFATAVVLAIGWAPLHGYGHATAPGNSSVEPLDYATAVPTVIVAVWAFAGAWFAIAFLRRGARTRKYETP